MSELQFSTLEIEILNWIKSKYQNPILTEQINNVAILKREYTGVGWFIDLQVSDSIKPFPTTFSNPIDGPFIRSLHIEYDGGSILFHDNGYITLLELYSNGGKFEKELSDYKLLDYDQIHK